MQCLIAAVQNGADAVYFGGGEFNARRGAENFSGESLREAIDYCRLRGVKTHITLNTLLFDRELYDAVSFAAMAYRLGCDAVIVQDVGLAKILRAELPGLAIHASTQMGIHDIGGVEFCRKNGITRAVLSRELPLIEIRRLHSMSDLELEFFCHGALCMGFSGSCLYSSMAGERSGNRGSCAQPCRKCATVAQARRASEEELCLSPNDICMIDELGALRDAGIVSFKIEGRMKSPEYVATVTRIYRNALDGRAAADSRAKLFDIFNRGEFSTSHLYSDSVRTGGIGRARPDRGLVGEAQRSVQGEKRSVPIVARLEVTPHMPSELTLECKGRSVTVTGDAAEVSQREFNPGRYAAQIAKLGGTAFAVGSVEVSGGGFIPVSTVNAMRRRAADELAAAMLERREADVSRAAAEAHMHHRTPANGSPLCYVKVRTVAQARAAIAAGADIVAIEPVEPAAFELKTAEDMGFPHLWIALPNVLLTQGAHSAYKRLIDSGVFSGAEVNNIGQAAMVEHLSERIAGIGVNVCNSASMNMLLDMGFTGVIPSPELTSAQLRSLSNGFGSAMIINVYGRTPLMQLLHCPVKEYRGCQSCRGSAGVVTDGEGRRFPLSNMRFGDDNGRYCLVRMNNCSITYTCDIVHEAGMVYAYGAVIECGDDAAAAVRAIKTGGERPADFTRGHWNRRVN